MASTASRSANTVNISSSSAASTIDAVTAKNIRLLAVVITSGATAETLALSDVSTTIAKLTLKGTANATQFYDFSDSPITFPNGIRVAPTDVSAITTLIIEETRT